MAKRCGADFDKQLIGLDGGHRNLLDMYSVVLRIILGSSLSCRPAVRDSVGVHGCNDGPRHRQLHCTSDAKELNEQTLLLRGLAGIFINLIECKEIWPEKDMRGRIALARPGKEKLGRLPTCGEVASRELNYLVVLDGQLEPF